MKTPVSHNTERTSFLKEFIIPSPFQIVLYILSSALILCAFNSRAIWVYLNNNPQGQQRAMTLFGEESVSQSTSQSSGILSQGRLSQILIWTVVGVLIYTVIWFLKNILNNIRNDIVADEYVHPKSYSRLKFWKSVLLRKIFFIFNLVVLLVVILAFIKIGPSISNIFYQAVDNFKFSDLYRAALATLLLSLMMHVAVIMIHSTINSWRFIYTDL